jgi:short-subunit dehydrogenase
MKSYVLITGAAGGLGKAFAVECAARGWDLFLTDLSEGALVPLAEGLARLHGVNVRYATCDLVDSASRDAFWGHVQRMGASFHQLINVAGVDYEGPFRERQTHELRTMVRLNIEATVEMTRRVLEYRDLTRPLRVINVSSLASYYPMPVKAVYAASKRFLLDLTLALRQEHAADEVTFTALCPAGLPTTRGALHGIEAQGFMGRVTTMNVGAVAARTIDLALAGRAIYIPGWINQLIQVLGSLFPPAMVAHLIAKRWMGARERRPPVWEEGTGRPPIALPATR